jgi:hypothetical protein
LDGGALILEDFNNAGNDIPYKYGNNPFNYNGWLCKLDSAGGIVWSLVLGGSGDQAPSKVKELEPGIYSVLINTNSTDYMLAGINPDSINYVPWLLQIDTGGHILSSRVMKDPNDSTAYNAYTDFAIPNKHSIIFTGQEVPVPTSYCFPGMFGSQDFIFICIDSSFNVEWCTPNGGSNADHLEYACVINDSLVVAAGISQSIDDDLSHCSNFSSSDLHTWIGLYNLNQHHRVWQQCLCGSNDDEVMGLLYDNAESAVYVLIQGGSFDGDFAGFALPNSGNMYLLKYTPVTTGINNIKENDVNVTVSPNPCTDNLYLTYTNLPATHQYYFTACNILGQPIAKTPIAPVSPLGDGRGSLPCNTWQPGIYIWQVTDESGERLAEGKVVKE